MVVFSSTRDRRTYADIVNAGIFSLSSSSLPWRTHYTNNIYEDVVLATFQIMKNGIYFRIGSTSTPAPPKNREEYDRESWVKAHLSV